MSRQRRLVLVLAALLAFSGAALGQATGGSVIGQALDQNGAAILNATVTLKSEATGQTLTTQTSGSGGFTFPNTLGGEYTVTVEAQGFQAATEKVKVLLNQESTVNVVLTPAGVSSVVDVTSSGEALVQTDTSQVGRNFETRQVEDLPIFNDVRSLALLSPNVVAQGVGVAGDGGSVGGTRPHANAFNVDGVDNNSPDLTGKEVNIIQDAISEVSILTNNYNAEFGTGAAGQFNTVTKSGTNKFHGSVFGYLQNRHLNAASTSEEFNLQTGVIDQKVPFTNPRYGGTLGGPIFKNKLFFFGAYQRDQINQQSTGVSYTAPTSAGLTQIAALPGASAFVINMLRNNLVLPETATETQTVLGRAGIPFGVVSLVTPGGFLEKQYQINIDHLMDSRNQFRYRFSSDNIGTEQPGNGNPKFNNQQNVLARLFSAGWIHTVNSSVVNEVRLSYKRFLRDYPLNDPAFNTFPNITVAPLNLGLGPNGNLPQGGLNHSYQIYNALSYSRGSHNFKFGGEMRFLIFTSFFLPRGRGDYNYATLDELIRDVIPTNVDLRGVGSAAFTGNQRKYYAFAQDDWKVTPNLTLNLGLRYEYLGLPRDAALQGLNSIANVPGVIEFNVPKTDKNNFSPRLGLAYSPEFTSRLGRIISGSRGQSSFRAAFGINYYETYQNLYLLNLPPQFQQEIGAAAFGYTPPFLQNGGVSPTPIPPNTVADARAATGSYINNAVEPYIMSGTLSYQRELGRSTLLELRYLHTAGRHLPVQVRLNGGLVDYSRLVMPTFLAAPGAAQLAGRPTLGSLGLNNLFPKRLAPYGFVGAVTSFEPEGNSVYDGGSVSLTRRLTNGLALTAAYTFSKAIDNATNELFSSTVNPRRAQDGFDLRQERSLSAIDVPHRFAASFNYDLPFFKRSNNGLLKGVLGGWQINGVFQTQSGQLMTPQSVLDSNRNGDAAGDRTIVNLGGVRGTGSGVYAVNALGQRIVDGSGADVLGDPSTVGYVAINGSAEYIQAGPGARANAGRNTLRTNSWNRTDMTLVKNIRFGEDRYNVQFAAEVGNLFNQRIRTIGDFGSPFFVNQNDFNGTNQFGIGAVSFAFPDVTSPLFNNYSAGNFSGRTVQLRAKFVF
ncbi:MAG TPA: TonB-dependent receptor [Pyrinomonadaceae bacterium]|nr:TonB-dependent receptor [Pyrinomonadaceae bacterium]